MDPELAAIIAHDTRTRAVEDARADLDRLQRRAVEAARDESRRLVKVSHIDPTTGQATYRPAGRLLRDWYLHCYLNTLRGRLGAPAVRIDAQQVEDTAGLLHRLTPSRTPLAALRAVAVLRDIADADAARATVTIITTLHATAARRAIAHAPDTRFDADPVRVHVTRHWYLHCYLDHLQTAARTRLAHPTLGDALTHQIAITLTTGTIQPLVLPAIGEGHRTDRDNPITTGHPARADERHLVALDGPAEDAARAMFNHPATLEALPVTGSRRAEAGADGLPAPADPAVDWESFDRGTPATRHA